MKALYNFNNKTPKIAENGGGSGGGFAPKTICPPASKPDTDATKFDSKIQKDKKSDKNFSGFFAFFQKKNLKKPEIRGWQKFANTSYKKKVLIPSFCFACMGIFTSCDALATQKQFTRDAVFEFGLNNFSEFTPISNFTDSFNSPTVRYVILQSDGLSWQATPVSDISNQIHEIITNARPEQLHKLRGRGILFDVYIDNPTDSLNLTQIGLKFKNAVHNQNINRWHANQKQK